MTLVTEFQGLVKRDFATGIDLSPTAAIPLLDGEFLAMSTTAATQGQLVRVANLAVGVADGDCCTFPTYAVSTERGRYDTQAIGKATVLFGGFYEADFRVWDLTDNGNIAVGDHMVVGNCNPDLGDAATPARSMLTTNGRAASDVVVGWCTRAPSNAGNAGSIIRVYVGGFAIAHA